MAEVRHAEQALSQERILVSAPEAKLCYVRGGWAYFTTRELSDQWGDDWNDAPYEHNAGNPYEWGEFDANRGVEAWHVVKVAYDGPLYEPCEPFVNSAWSVEDINGGATPWLRSDQWHDDGTPLEIMAGTTLADFIPMVNSAGGNVYLAVVS